ncbi:hypothetical protein ABZ725_50830 [Streptomyces sp. NPDC006872]|uniref:hypothetical protein n=1 Tax=Streptomyces sp. NPDC006872 TaxID=3155720 RepID=UPI0034110B7C
MFWIATAAVYGYVIVLSLWAMRVQRQAARVPHHPHDHPAMQHAVERSVHGHIATVLVVSLVVRLTQLTTGLTPWVLVPLTVLVALPTTGVLTAVWRMASEDLHNWHIMSLNRLKTTVLLVCTAGLIIDQVWRVVTLF